jgi:hypothetical protein
MSFSDTALEFVERLDQDLKTWPYVWIGDTYLPERKKQKCRIIPGKRSKKHTILELEFEDGTRVLGSPAFFRKRAIR